MELVRATCASITAAMLKSVRSARLVRRLGPAAAAFLLLALVDAGGAGGVRVGRAAAAGVAANPSPAAAAAPASPATPAETAADPSEASDLPAARALFQANLKAIHDRNRAAYLACYLHSERVALSGPEGTREGFGNLEASAGQAWPDNLEADDIHLTPVRPGLVYGSYRYRVRYGADESSGLSQRLFVKTDAGWKIAVTSAFPAEPGVPPPPRALIGATLLDGTGAPPVADAVVLLRDGKIECAGRRAACPVPPGIDTLDLSGSFLTPGLIDSHVHFSQTGWADGRPDALDVRDRHPYEKVEAGLRLHPERFGRSYLCSGVTAVFDVGGYSWTLGLPAWAEPRSDVARVAAAGPLLSTRDHWVNLAGDRQFIFLHDAESARTGVRYLAEQGSSAVKVWFIPVQGKEIATDLAPLVQAAGEEARQRKLPLIVHATGLTEAKEALRAGARLLVHSVWDKPVDQEFLDLAIKNGALYCPTLTVGHGYLRLYESDSRHQPPAVDDPNGCVDRDTLARVAETAAIGSTSRTAQQLTTLAARTAEREATAAANLLRVFRAGIPIAMGTDAGNPLTLHGPAVYAEMEAMEKAGLAPREVLVTATRGAAAAMGRLKDLGTVEKGKLADLLVVGADPTAAIANLRQIRYVVRGGVVRPLAELKALAAPPPPPPPPAAKP
ncbi:MAG TPA: amidohydrolase family protein [Thermoanaerobaculia bacterium]|nr:amidohydrolase family protein [Thermoanaerobaculia bacterium]